jgi:thiol-disulfide isomerase/thioredoxin
MGAWNTGWASQLAAPAIGIASSVLVGLRLPRRRGVDALPLLAKLIVASLLVARIAFLLQHRANYGGSLLSMIDITDGGFSPMAGLFTAFVAGAELTRTAAAARRPLVIAALVGTVAWAAATVATLSFAPARTAVPLVEVKRLDGSPVQLRTFTGKPLVVNLWATWCPPCRREMPVLRDAQRRHADITFVFVNQGESAAAIHGYLARERLDIYNVFADPAAAVAKRSASFAYPTTLFFDSGGMLFMRQVGGLDAAGLEQRLAMLRMAGR